MVLGFLIKKCPVVVGLRAVEVEACESVLMQDIFSSRTPILPPYLLSFSLSSPTSILPFSLLSLSFRTPPSPPPSSFSRYHRDPHVLVTIRKPEFSQMFDTAVPWLRYDGAQHDLGDALVDSDLAPGSIALAMEACFGAVW